VYPTEKMGDIEAKEASWLLVVICDVENCEYYSEVD